ncbi:MAG: ComEC/Rec2 family competence protein, partial [Candidatus Omnitrophota bacterium]
MIKRPFLLPVIFFLTGIFVTDLGRDRLMAIHVSLVIGLLFLMFFSLILLFERPKLFYIVLCLFFLFLGVFRCASLMVCGKGTIGAFAGSSPKETVLYGLVSGDPERRAGSYSPYFIFPLKAERILSEKEEHPVAGTVLVSLFNPERTPRIGDRLVMSGRLSLPRFGKNPAGFDRETQLKRSGIGAVMSSAGNDCHLTARAEKGPLVRIKRGLSTGRAAAGGVIRKYLSGNTEAIVGSAVLGLRSGVKKQLNDIFARTGTAHVLAVSGLHVGIVAVVFMGLLRGMKCPRRPACFLTILVICVFGVFAGGRPSSLRAAIMGSFILFGMAFERKTDVMNALLLSALAVTFFRPDHLFRAGFILSYAAVLSIVWLTPLADAFLGIKPVKRNGQPAIIREYSLKLMSVSLAAWIGTMPVVVSYFRMVTPAAVLANLAAVPSLFLVVTFGFGLIIAVITGVPSLFVVFIAGILDIIISLLVVFLRAISEVPFSFVKTAAPSVMV